jgi:hypothetical protein
MKTFHDMAAAIGQFLLCVAGGFWAGYAAEPDAVGTAAAGAMGLGLALFAAYAAAHAVGMVIGTGQFVGQVARRVADAGKAGAGDAHRARVSRDDRRLRVLRMVVAIVVLLLCSGLAGLLVWLVAADGAGFLATLLRCVAVGTGAALLMPHALRAVDEVQVGGPPP